MWPGTESNCRHEDFQSRDGGGTRCRYRSSSKWIQKLEADHLSLFTLARLTLGPNAFKRYLSLFCYCSRNLYVAELGSIALAVPQRPVKKLL